MAGVSKKQEALPHRSTTVAIGMFLFVEAQTAKGARRIRETKQLLQTLADTQELDQLFSDDMRAGVSEILQEGVEVLERILQIAQRPRAPGEL